LATRQYSSKLAQGLVLELHEPMKNEERWEIADRFLFEAWRTGFQAGWWVKGHIAELPEQLLLPAGEAADSLPPSEGGNVGSNPTLPAI
jgi:hypothetical protein